MTDLVVTCPQHFWQEWIAEGDPAGTPHSGQEWGWFTSRGSSGIKYKPPIEVGERLYVVAWNRLRGYAPVTDVRMIDGQWVICRQGDAVAITIDLPIRGFQGWRKVWWPREAEKPFIDWRTAEISMPNSQRG